MNDRDYTRMKKAELLTTPGCPEGSDDAFDLVEALERLAEGRAVELRVFRQHVRHQAAEKPPLHQLALSAQSLGEDAVIEVSAVNSVDREAAGPGSQPHATCRESALTPLKTGQSVASSHPRSNRARVRNSYGLSGPRSYRQRISPSSTIARSE